MAKRPQGKARRTGKRRAATIDESGVIAALPKIDALHDVPAFQDLRLDDAQRAAFDAFCAEAEDVEQMQVGCVVRLDRGFPLVATESETLRAEHAVGFAKQRKDEAALLPAVGDWVALRRAPGHDMGVIECVLPRRTAFERWRGKNRGERQVLCANVDTILVVQPLGAGEVLLGRIAR